MSAQMSLRDTARALIDEWAFGHPGIMGWSKDSREWLAQLIMIGQFVHLCGGDEPKIALAGFDALDRDELRRQLLIEIANDPPEFTAEAAVCSLVSVRSGQAVAFVIIGSKPKGITSMVTKLSATGFELFPREWLKDLIACLLPTEPRQQGAACVLSSWIKIRKASDPAWETLKAQINAEQPSFSRTVKAPIPKS